MSARNSGARLAGQLWFQVLLATLAGVALGIVAPHAAARMKPLGDAFIALVRMLIAPIIFCTVVHGIARMSDLRRVGRVAIKALVYFELITTLALVFALIAVNVIKPGAGMNVGMQPLNTAVVAEYAGRAQHQSLVQYLLGIIPETFVGAFAHPEVLPALAASILFAAGLSAAGARGRPVLELVESLSQVFFRMVAIVMWVAPLGAFGAIAFTVGSFGAGSLVSLAKLLVEFYAVSLAFVTLVFGAVAYAIGASLWRLLGFIRDEIVIVAATTSTETVLPRLMEKLQRLGCEESVVGLVVPTGYSFNLDGTCLYLATAVVFLAQATHTPLGMAQQLALLAVLLLTSKGAAGVAGAGFVVLAGTLAAVGTIPLASLALVLGIHRLMAEALTFVNLVGNCLATLVIARWEGALDLHVMSQQIGLRPARAAAAVSTRRG